MSFCAWRRDRPEHRRMAVAERVDGDTSAEIEVFLAIGIPQTGSLTADG